MKRVISLLAPPGKRSRLCELFEQPSVVLIPDSNEEVTWAEEMERCSTEIVNPEYPPNQEQHSGYLVLHVPEEELERHFSLALKFDKKDERTLPSEVRSLLDPLMVPWTSLHEDGIQLIVDYDGWQTYGQELPKKFVLDVEYSYVDAVCRARCDRFFFSFALWQGIRVTNAGKLVVGSCDLCNVSFLKISNELSVPQEEMVYYIFRPAACIGQKPTYINEVLRHSVKRFKNFAPEGRLRCIRNELFICCEECQKTEFVECVECYSEHFSTGANLYHSKASE